MAVRQVVSGLAGQFTKGLIGGLANNARGMINGRGSDNSSSSGIQNKSKYFTNNLSYPMDVETDPMQGHYILFHINEITRPKVKRSQKSKHADKIKKSANKEFGKGKEKDMGDGVAIVKVDKAGREKRDKLQTGASSKAAIGGAEFSLYKEQQSFTRLQTSIALYMPAQVQASYSLDYSDVPIGAFGEGLKDMFDALKQFSSGNMKASKIKLGDSGQNLEQGIKKMALNTLDTVAPGIRAQAQIAAGKVFSDKMELSFEKVNRRSFNFNFVFMPKSEQEAKTIDHIIHMFKFHSHPSYVEGTKGRELSIPDTFDIEYMYQEARNNFINKISTCFLKEVGVTYGGDRFTAHRPTEGLHGYGAPPTRTTLALTFQEMEILTRQRIDEGF